MVERTERLILLRMSIWSQQTHNYIWDRQAINWEIIKLI
jgi:hypothetical protein